MAHLVIGRRPGEAFTIGDNIRVEVVRIKPDGAVVISIKAPEEVRILRDDAVRRER